jgi:hypothetical protein
MILKFWPLTAFPSDQYFAFLSISGVIISFVCSLLYFFCSSKKKENNVNISQVSVPTYIDNNVDITATEETPLLISKIYVNQNQPISKFKLSSPHHNASPTKKIRYTDDMLVQDIDYYIRHREDFYSPGYLYSVKRLQENLHIPVELKIKSLINFLRSRAEFKVKPDLRAFELVALTPFRDVGVKVYGEFKCISMYCRFF